MRARFGAADPLATAGVRFMYNERRAREEDTPASMDMLEEDGFDTEGVEVSVHAFQVRVCKQSAPYLF